MSAYRKTYRVYRLDGVLKMVGVEEVEADGDEDAIARVESGDFGLKCEIWEGHRLVATLERERRSSQDGGQQPPPSGESCTGGQGTSP